MSQTSYQSPSGRITGLRTSRRAARGTLVLLHGAAQNRAAFGALTEALESLDVLCLDAPGRGESPGPARTSVRGYSEDLDEVLEALAQEGPLLLGGHSLGGAVALECALRSPAELTGLVLMSTGARLRVHPTILEQAARVARAEMPRARGLAFGPNADPALVEALESAFDAVPPATALADWQMTNGFDRLADVPGVSTETLVVHGDADPLTPLKYAEHLSAQLPHAELAVIEGGSHMLVAERAREVAAAIDAFARKRPPL